MSSIFDSFLDKARDVADAATKKTGEFVEISKYKLETVKLNNEIEKLHQQLGKSVYSMVKGGYENQTLIDGLVDEIDELMLRLEAVNDKISDMKNVVYCHACGAKNEMDNFYCAKCGSKLKTEFSSDAAYAKTEEENVADDTVDCE